MSFKAEPIQKKANYYSIKEATFRLKTDKDDSEAIRREYTNPKTGEEGVAYERAYKALYGLIHDVTFTDSTLKDGTILRNLNIDLGEDEGGLSQIISIASDSRYATDFLTRLPLIDLGNEVRLMPYDFEKDGPRRVGIALHQKDGEGNFTIQVGNTFFTKVEEKDGKKTYTNLHGYPEPTEDDATDWPFYFKRVNKFLINYAKENIVPKFRQLKPMPKSFEEQESSDDFPAF